MVYWEQNPAYIHAFSLFYSILLGQMIKKNNIFSIIPVIVFIVGYLGSYYWIGNKSIVVPNIVGKKLTDAVTILSNELLALRVLHYRYDSTQSENTILDQIPRSPQKIHFNQPVLVTLASKQREKIAIDFWAKSEDDIKKILQDEGYEINFIMLESTYPRGMCIAQFPLAGQHILNNKIHIYLSLGKSLTTIMPNFFNESVMAVKNFLLRHGIILDIFHDKEIPSDHTCDQCLVTFQYPQHGVIVTLNPGFIVQVYV